MSILSPLAWVVAFALVGRLTQVIARRNTGLRAACVGGLWPWLWAAPAVLAQVVSMGEDALENPLFVAIGWLIAVGGHSVTLIFEANVGDRQSTLADQFGFYLVIWSVQLAVVFVLGLLRFRACGRLRDKWMIGLGIGVLVNGLLNISWPWWGT